MSADSAPIQKELAVAQHSRQAGEFDARYRARYAADPAAPFRTCFAYSRWRLDAALARHLPEGRGLRLLDAGCGTGHHLARLRERGFDVAGVDGSEDMLRFAREHNPGCDIQRADVDALPFPDASFDVVLSVEVFRYLPDTEKAIAEMCRVLRPGGRVLVTAAPLLSLQGYPILNRVARAMELGGLVRLRQFFTTSAGIRASFARAELRDVRVEGVYLGPLIWLERLAPRLLPAALRAWAPLDARLADVPVLRDLSNMYLASGRVQ